VNVPNRKRPPVGAARKRLRVNNGMVAAWFPLRCGNEAYGD
jgi:hypothetical protein